MPVLTLTKLIGNKTNALQYEDANRVYKYVCLYLDKNQPVILSFKGIHLCSAVFLNIAIGQLYSRYEPAFISKMVACEDLPPSIRPTLRRVISNAKAYFQVGGKDGQEKAPAHTDGSPTL